MKISEESKDTIKRIYLAQRLHTKYPYFKYIDVYNFAMTVPNLYSAESRFILLNRIKL